MYIVNENYKGAIVTINDESLRIQNINTTINLDNASQRELELLFGLKHPAVSVKAEKKAEK